MCVSGNPLARVWPPSYATRRRRRCVYAPTSNTASHDNHEKINSWASFTFIYGFRLSYYARSHQSLGVFRYGCHVLDSHVFLRVIVIKAIEHFLRVNTYLYSLIETLGDWGNSRKLYKPSSTCRVCKTVILPTLRVFR